MELTIGLTIRGLMYEVDSHLPRVMTLFTHLCHQSLLRRIFSVLFEKGSILTDEIGSWYWDCRIQSMKFARPMLVRKLGRHLFERFYARCLHSVWYGLWLSDLAKREQIMELLDSVQPFRHQLASTACPKGGVIRFFVFTNFRGSLTHGTHIQFKFKACTSLASAHRRDFDSVLAVSRSSDTIDAHFTALLLQDTCCSTKELFQWVLSSRFT